MLPHVTFSRPTMLGYLHVYNVNESFKHEPCSISGALDAASAFDASAKTKIAEVNNFIFALR